MQTGETLTQAPRTPLNIEISFKRSYARAKSNGKIKNLSLTGAFLAHRGESLKPGEKVNLNFSLMGRERDLQSIIIWSNSFGSGIKFLPQNNQDVQILDDLIYFVENRRIDTRGILEKIFQKL